MPSLDAAITDVVTRCHRIRPQRVILAIAGAPGAGKSTVAGTVHERARAAGVSSVVVGMDGWHLAHSVLMAQGLGAVKGAPRTFDADGFAHAMQRVRSQPRHTGSPTVWLPEFRRDLEDAVAGAIAVTAEHELVIVEGNYLLLQQEPWATAAECYDITWMLRPDEPTRQQRLIERHERFGRTHEEAVAHAMGSDQRNAELVLNAPLPARTIVVTTE